VCVSEEKAMAIWGGNREIFGFFWALFAFWERALAFFFFFFFVCLLYKDISTAKEMGWGIFLHGNEA
jgi:hypothetical protein